MKQVHIGWADNNYDMELDGEEQVLVTQQWGNKGLGLIVFVMCDLAVAIPTFFTILQIASGKATGNPIGALIFLFAIFAWPIYWGINQFFLKRRLVVDGEYVKFELKSLLSTRRFQEKIADYGKISYGRTKSTSRHAGGIATTGKYFVRLSHKNRDRQVVLYEHIQSLMSKERMERYSQKLGLPLEDVTPDQTHAVDDFKKKAEAFLESRKTETQD